MAVPYTTQAISGYNSSPPADDGSTGDANEVTWAKPKTKLADPIKALAEAMNTELLSAFAKGFLNNIVSLSTNTTIDATYKGKLVDCTGTMTLTLLAAATASSSFPLIVRNSGSGAVTIDGNASETINGSTTLVLSAGQAIIMGCDGTDWVGLVVSETSREGSGNGLDADTVDGNEASYLLAFTNMTGTVSTSQIADDSITSDKIPSNAVGTLEIAADSVGNSEMLDDAIKHAEIDFTLDTGGSWSVSATQVIPEGIYIAGLETEPTADSTTIQVNQASTWRGGANAWGGGVIISDGTNVRISYSGSGSAVIYYRRLA